MLFSNSNYKLISILLVILSTTCLLYNLHFNSPWQRHQILRTNATSVRPAEDKFVCRRKVEEKIFLLADDDTLMRMNQIQLMEMYWKYINTLQVLCRNQIRLGSMKDGGKEICLDGIYKPRRPCLVYSFGSNFQFDFELSVIRNFKCEVHTFDPSHPIKNLRFPPGINFHLTGLWNSSKTNKYGWKMKSLDDIRRKLNHEKRVIDVLKIDVEGAEWNALPDMFQSGVLKYVKQLSIEIHVGERNVGDVSVSQQIKILRRLYEHGFHIFMQEHNLYSTRRFKYPYPFITTVNEISLINVNWKA
ncbi:probable methyltransferase-like protein 24 [Mercenaria mercenaria]|uniref:probable methyltransferase-like protein 24 n=1 Tax=Mercenaria mercenaria TaxID=6596 RepID=UPI00234EFCA2|nr:probable methyltransferase-like protein 24 [Mercenaria mercenaria]